MDSQTCPIYIQSYAYIENVLNLTWHVDAALGFPIGYNPSIVLNDMQIMEQDWAWLGFGCGLYRARPPPFCYAPGTGWSKVPLPLQLSMGRGLS